jgi:polyhydroxybutyrate depolymerase
MNRSICFFVCMAVFLFVGCSETDNVIVVVKDDGKGANTANENTLTLEHKGLNREYVLFVPSAYDSATAIPLLFNFHGFGGNASEYMAYADMRTLAESEGFILVYPQGSDLDGSPHWNTCPNGGDNKSNADDFGFIAALVSELSGTYSIDQKRIYAAGYSNGGMMAYGLANYRSEIVAAVASVSGTMLDCTATPEHPMPVIHLHGTADDTLPYDGNNYYKGAQTVLNHWIAFNNTNSSPTVTSDTSGSMAIERYVYDQGDAGVAVTHYKYIGGGHHWFTASYQGEDTARLIWDFVSQYDINGLR